MENKEQQKLLSELVSFLDSDFGRYGKIALLTGIDLKNIMKLATENIQLKNADLAKLIKVINEFKNK